MVQHLAAFGFYLHSAGSLGTFIRKYAPSPIPHPIPAPLQLLPGKSCE